jgi:hypothetical protein
MEKIIFILFFCMFFDFIKKKKSIRNKKRVYFDLNLGLILIHTKFDKIKPKLASSSSNLAFECQFAFQNGFHLIYIFVSEEQTTTISKKSIC